MTLVVLLQPNCLFISFFRIACVYTPSRNPGRDDFLVSCGLKVDPSIPTIVGGDFNALFNRQLDRRGSNAFDSSRESCASLCTLFNDCVVVDVWRYLHPQTVAFSWMRSDESLSSCIDFFWLFICMGSCCGIL